MTLRADDECICGSGKPFSACHGKSDDAEAELARPLTARPATAPEAPPSAAKPDGRGASADQPSILAARLFADDVSLTNGLPLSLSVETLGGVSTILILRSTGLPAVRRETFSTATNNQSSIEVHLLVGDRTLAVNNVTVGKFSVVEIPPAPRGVPRFRLEIEIDERGTLRFSAKDLATGKSQPVSCAEALSSPLSQSKVRGMLDDAKTEEAKGEYGVPKTTPDELDSVTVYTAQLRKLVESTRATLDNGTAIPETARRRCEEELQNAERVLKTNALPERASAKLNALKADELEAVLRALGETAKRCR